MPKKIIRNLTGKNRDKKYDLYLGIILAFIAGTVNAGGFLAVGYYTSHMSGIVSSIADFIAIERFNLAGSALLFLLSFILGATTSSIIMSFAKERNLTSKFALPLMLEAFLLMLFGSIVSNYFNFVSLSVNLTISLLCFIMGLQNAIITRVSNARIRTTHVTGIATDIGIESGRYIYCIFSEKKDSTFNSENFMLYISLLISFLGGGICGAFSFKYFGFITVLPLSFILAILASVPIIDDFTSKK
ncbi:MAG: YoaK family protein [Rickettsiales bacterium]